MVNPTSPHPTPDELAGYTAHRLAAADVLRLSDHLDECAVCREAVGEMRVSPRRQPGEYLYDPASEMPTFQELAGEIDGTLTPEQHGNLSANLAASAAARDALADLRAFRQELAALPEHLHGPGQLTVVGTTPGTNHKIISPPYWRARKVPAWTAGLAALFIALAVGCWVFAQRGHGTSALLRDARGQSADLTALPADLRQSVESALQTQQLPPSPAAVLISGGEELAGTTVHSAMRTVAPVGTVVRTIRPTLRWSPHPEATNYQVAITPAGGGPVVSSPELPARQTEWTPPEALTRGETYEWQVAALRDGKTIDHVPKPPAGEAYFQVLDAKRESALASVEKQAASYPLILGVAYWRAGITDAAVEQFHRLARAQVTSSTAERLERAATLPGKPPQDADGAAPSARDAGH